MRTITKVKYATVIALSGFMAACSNNPKIIEPALGAASVQTGIVETPRGPSLTLNNVLFDFEQCNLRSEADVTVSQAVSYLNANPDRQALIEGHTDVTGDKQFNQALSLKRSESVKNALIDQGISASRIVTSGLGETTPIADNDSLAGRQSNRRVEIIFSPAN